MGAWNRIWVSYMCLGCVIVGLGSRRVSADTCDLTQVPFCTWAGNNSGFFSPGDTGSFINFQTLPNGAPSFGGAAITPAFNYVLQGALFNSPSNLFITGNSQLGYGLWAYSSSVIVNSTITAQLTNPEKGVGVTAFDHTTLYAYDAEFNVITSVSVNSFGNSYFLGIKSNTPIAWVVIDNGTNSNTIDNFTMIHFPVPEPGSAALLLLTAPILLRRRAVGTLPLASIAPSLPRGVLM